MTNSAFFMWGMLLAMALVFGLLLLGVKPSLWWSMSLGFAVGVVWRRLAVRRGSK